MTNKHNNCTKHNINMKKVLFTLIALCLFGVAKAQTNIEKAEAIYEQGRTMVHQKQFKEALALWEGLVNTDITPDYKAKYLALCGVLSRDSLHSKDKALEFFHRAEMLYPEVKALKDNPIETDIIYASMGLAQYCDSVKDYTTAIQHYEKAIDFVNHVIMEGIPVVDMDYNDLNVMLLSFKQGIAIDYGHNRQFEDSQSAFEELKFEYGQMELSSDSDIVMQGWMFGCMMRQAYAIMYEKDMQDCQKAMKETNELLDKIMTGLNTGNQAIIEGLSYQMPMFLFFAATINNKVNNPATAINLCDNALTWPSADNWKPFIINTKGEAHLLNKEIDKARACWLEVKTMIPGYYDTDDGDMPLRDKFGRK